MVDKAEANDWPFENWLRLAVFQMKLTPKEFWDMDLKDWLVLCRPMKITRFTRQNLEDLLKQFPDEEGRDES